MDYDVPQRRSNKNDKRAKARFNRFKRGGMHRTQNVQTDNPATGKEKR